MTNLVYQNDGTQIIWDDTSVAARTFGTKGLASGAGRQGDLFDLGSSARSPWYAWRANIEFEAQPVVGEVVRVYIMTSDGTYPDNDDNVLDTAVSAEDKLKNLLQIGSIIVDEAIVDKPNRANGLIRLPHQWVAPVFWNATADQLQDTNNINIFALTPIPLEIQ